MAAGLAQVLYETPEVVARILGVRCGAVDLIALVVGAYRQHVARGDFDVVLPGQRVATAVEARAESPVLIGIGLVLAAPGLQGYPPGLQWAEARARAEHFRLAIGIGAEARRASTVHAVVIVVRFGLQQVGVQLQAIVEAVAGGKRGRQVAIAIGIVFITAGACRLHVDAIGVRTADAQAVPATAVAAGNAGAARVGVMSAVAGGEERLDALPLALAGEYLDHSADGFRAVQAGTGAAYHLDTFDQLQRQILQGRPAGGHRADLDTVDHHQHVVGLGAAHEQRGGLARPAVVGQRNARHLLEQFG